MLSDKELEQRRDAFEGALASFELDGFTLTPDLIELSNDFVAGKINMTEYEDKFLAAVAK